jgi:DNA-binding HxlR family transcriptional regulator
MLSERLQELEAEEILERTVIPETRVRVRPYRSTDAGSSNVPVLSA